MKLPQNSDILVSGESIAQILSKNKVPKDSYIYSYISKKKRVFM